MVPPKIQRIRSRLNRIKNMNRGLIVFVTLLSLLFLSCERTVDTPVETAYQHPFLSDLMISPGAFNTDTILVNGETNPQDIITLSMTATLRIDIPAGTTVQEVLYDITRPSDRTVWGNGYLRDDGIAPDAVAGDGVYSASVRFSIRRVEGGYFALSVRASTGNMSSSNVLHHQFGVFRSSRAPFLFNLSAPDTVALPPPNAVALILLTVTANDSDGLADIEEVFFRNLDSPSDTTRKFMMYDDGDLNGVSGDSTAGDSVFSLIVQLPSNTTVGTYRFLFEATDRFGTGSNTILHPLTVYRPE